MKKGYFKIRVEPLLSPEYWEKLEEKLRDFFSEEGIAVDIYDSVTGNNTVNY